MRKIVVAVVLIIFVVLGAFVGVLYAISAALKGYSTLDGDNGCVPVIVVSSSVDTSTSDTTDTSTDGEGPTTPETAPVTIELVLLTIAAFESGGGDPARIDYAAHSATSSASGAYQFTDATWSNYQVYAHASDAPSSVQDAYAAVRVAGVLGSYGLAAVSVFWYYPAALTNASLLDQVPAGGNRWTPREYRSQWLELYVRIAGGFPAGLTIGGGPGCTGVGGIADGSTVDADIAPVIEFALAQLGKPYVWGASGPEAFDCSGLTLRAYQIVGINLPHYSSSQALKGRSVDWSGGAEIHPGDLIFKRGGNPVHDFGHVGIALNSTQWILAPRTGDIVKIAPIPFVEVQSIRRLLEPKPALPTN